MDSREAGKKRSVRVPGALKPTRSDDRSEVVQDSRTIGRDSG